ncbi:MAG: DUF2157 domain-containing protein [Tepidiformaceae bacterium]
MSFARKLEEESAAWVAEGLLPEATRESLLRRYPRDEGRRAVYILSAIGAAVSVLGITLIVAANWGAIPGLLKLAIGMPLMAALYAAGYALRFHWGYRKTGEALALMGTAAFLGNLSLISQQYHIQADPAPLVFALFAVLVPMMYLLRSRAFALLAPAALVVWVALLVTGDHPHDGRFETRENFGFGVALLLAGVGAALAVVGAGHRVTRFRGLAAPIECVGGAVLFGATFVLGFYRHDPLNVRLPAEAMALFLVAPGVVVAIVALLAAKRLAPFSDRRRVGSVAAALVSTMAVLALCLAVALWPREWLPQNAGFRDATANGERDLAVYTWGFWLLFGGLCTSLAWLGVAFRRDEWLTLALVAAGGFILARYFDLFDQIGFTGLTFVGAGLLLLVVALVLERSRRALIAVSEESS